MPIRPQEVYDNFYGHWDFLTTPADRNFGGQHFDRKEACRPRPDGSVPGSDILRFRNQVVECVSRPDTDGSLARGGYVVGARNQIYVSAARKNPHRKALRRGIIKLT